MRGIESRFELQSLYLASNLRCGGMPQLIRRSLDFFKLIQPAFFLPVRPQKSSAHVRLTYYPAYPNPLNNPTNPPVISAAHAGESALIPENVFLEMARNFILKDTINAARKLGIPEIARMTDLPPLEPPLSLDKVLHYYIKRRKPSKEEVKKMAPHRRCLEKSKLIC